MFAIAEDKELPKADILAGICGDDTELAGPIYDIVTSEKIRRRIEPSLADDELDNLITEYFERCILTDSKGEWALTRYGFPDSLNIRVVRHP
jgi:lipoprotein NlpI